jgi:hypothetical protein
MKGEGMTGFSVHLVFLQLRVPPGEHEIHSRFVTVLSCQIYTSAGHQITALPLTVFDDD